MRAESYGRFSAFGSGHWCGTTDLLNHSLTLIIIVSVEKS